MNDEIATPTSTARLRFGTRDSTGKSIFTVRKGIPMTDALTQVSYLLKCAQESAYELTDCGIQQRGLVGSTLNSIEGARALVDALLDGQGVAWKA
ncbi:MAG: DUF3077 domain-containing protein [Pseudomonas sp.]|nr:DUF3077 domain-containing protein [Pseudomonas sp.]